MWFIGASRAFGCLPTGIVDALSEGREGEVEEAIVGMGFANSMI